MKRILLLVITLTVFSFTVLSQQNIVSQKGDLIKIMIAPQHDNFMYKPGEKVTFEVALYKFGRPVERGSIYYEVGPEDMPPMETGTIKLKDGRALVKSKGLTHPGFLRCYVSFEENGKKYENTGTAGIAPDRIVTVTKMPADFNKFWKKNLAELACIPINSVVTLIPEACTHTVNVYKVRLDNIPVAGNHNTHVYGILCVPEKMTKAPAILRVPGAGVRAYRGLIKWAEKGFITFEIGINGIPVDLYKSEIYDDLKYGALWRYAYYNLNNRDTYYFKRVILSCIRAVDFIFTLNEFDGKNIGVYGGSQGGGLSIITASLDHRIKGLVSFYPAMCDMTGNLHNRAGGWPHMFTPGFVTSQAEIQTSYYYDVVNFARALKVPGFYSYGYNDNVCPPTSVCAALNVITAPKEIKIFYDTSHWSYPEQKDLAFKWMSHLLNNN